MSVGADTKIKVRLHASKYTSTVLNYVCMHTDAHTYAAKKTESVHSLPGRSRTAAPFYPSSPRTKLDVAGWHNPHPPHPAPVAFDKGIS